MKGIFKRISALLLAVALIIGGVNPVALKAAEAGEITLKLHYHRADGAYSGWDVWLWEAGHDGAGYAFVEENGEMVATKIITSGCSSVGFIVRNQSWDKDISEDQFIDIAEMLSGTVHIYVESGVKGYTKEYGEDAVKGVKIKSAKYDGGNSVSVEMTAPVEGDPASAFVLSGTEGAVEVSEVAAQGLLYVLKLKEELKSMGNYTVSYGDNSMKVTMPNVYSTEKFEAEYTYTGDDLGATWTKEKTSFRVWSPVAEAITVKLYSSGNATAADLLETIPMTRDVQGTWVAEKAGDLNGVYYVYDVTINGQKTEVVDPYARTTGRNGKRAMIIDLASTNPEGWDTDTNPNAGKSYTEAIIYEGHIRDLTADASANIEKPGTYLGLAELGTKTNEGIATGLSHILELGATHLHLLPFYDFGSVDEFGHGYNWGYDPVNYNVPEGSYSTDASKGEVRVTELKQMIKTMHDNGLSVVMDVVYNHVYSASDFSINQLVPGYFSRVSNSGVYSNGSGCGNDTASERSMVKKYIVDSVNYWADEYHIDGFRFDLVGLLDVETINEIVETVHEKHPDVIFYGEGWTMSTQTTKDDVALATQTNSTKTPDFAYFNDKVRDSIKGSVFESSGKGFVSGASGYDFAIVNAFLGKTSWCKSPSQTINYAACHDNNTLYDRLQYSRKDASAEQLASMNKLSAAIVLTSEGIPFLMSGEEMLRSKKNADGSFNENSYNAGDEVNALKYDSLSIELTKNVYEYYKGLIAFRKAHPALTLATAAEVEKYISSEKSETSGLVKLLIDGSMEGEKADKLYVIFNSLEEAQTIELPEGKWNVYVNGDQAGTKVLKTVSKTVQVEGISAMVLVQEQGVSAGLSKGAVTGICVGLAGLLAVLGAGIALIAKKKKK